MPISIIMASEIRIRYHCRVAGALGSKESQMNEKDQVKVLEQLEVIESSELKVGNAFHAFRFDVLSPEEIESTEPAKQAE
jgi:hypothetical protein